MNKRVVSLVTKTADSVRRFFDVYSNITVSIHHSHSLPLAFSLYLTYLFSVPKRPDFHDAELKQRLICPPEDFWLPFQNQQHHE
jgi:hypothetical protein